MRPADEKAAPTLSQRELQVLRLLAANRRDLEIAEALSVTRHTVRHHLRKLFAKLDVQRRADATRRAQELGILNRADS